MDKTEVITIMVQARNILLREKYYQTSNRLDMAIQICQEKLEENQDG